MCECEEILARIEERDDEHKSSHDAILRAFSEQRRSLRDSTWRILGMGLTVLGMAAALAGYVFVTSGEASAAHQSLRMSVGGDYSALQASTTEDHKAIHSAIEVVRTGAAVTNEKIKAVQRDRKKIDTIYEYVIKQNK